MTPSQELSATDHLRACALGNQVVLLDLRGSRYFSIGLDQWRRLIGKQTLPPLDQPAGRCIHASAPAHVPLEATPQRGVSAAAPPRQHCAFMIDPADRSWSEPAGNAATRVGVLRTCRLARAAAWAAYALRVHSLQHIVATISSTTVRQRHPQADKHALLDEAVAAFHTLRPLLHTSRDRCLQDSLALVRFLVSEGIAAHWVIGVKSAPFGAHAWVQSGSLVLNDLHENVRRYKPILVVQANAA